MNELFFEPKTTQYGSHMIMSNVHKSNKTKYINIDTKFREEYNYSQISNYNIILPERITEVKSMRVVSAEIPMTFFNISSSLGNNYFYIYNTTTPNNSKKINIPDGQYNTILLSSAINNSIKNTGLNLIYSLSGDVYDVSGTSSYFISNSNITINFAVNSDGTPDKFNFKFKLGWLLGFRNPIYVINTTSIFSEALVDINGSKYLYLAIEEFNKGNQSSFVPTLYSSILNKNIIARISLNKATHDFGKILPTNNYNGLLLSDTRSYSGKVDLLKLNIQLLNENGVIMNLNGMDFSFCIEVIHE
jgi:hypothetical protein